MVRPTSILLLFGLLFTSCGSGKEELSEEVVVVRIPPFTQRDSTLGEKLCQLDQFLFFPQVDEQESRYLCKGAQLTNDDSLLSVTVAEDGSVRLNNSLQLGSVSNTAPLKNRLKSLFDERTERGVFEPNSERVVKAVGIHLPDNAKYSDLVSVVTAVKESGADPIVLLLDGHITDLDTVSQ